MFIIIPVAIAGAALLALAVIVWRKWPYLKKLEPDAHPVGRTFLHDLAPEAVERINRLDWRAAWRAVLSGIEDALRHVRAAFTAIDRASERLGSSVRRVSQTAQRQHEKSQREAVEKVSETTKPAPVPEADRKESLKQEEQRLIVAIAQAPKDASLYRRLGENYVRMGNVTDAVESYRAAAKLAPEDTSIAGRLTHLQERLQKAESAKGE